VTIFTLGFRLFFILLQINLTSKECPVLDITKMKIFKGIHDKSFEMFVKDSKSFPG
jgi:hypothetical protein